jgi:hypothetical protein
MACHAVTDPWTVSAGDFPAAGTSEDKLRFALRYAILAPSSHNTQPWLFRVNDDRVELFADKRRLLSVVDPAGRELVISCGAALFILRLALKRFGSSGETAIFPGEARPDMLATVRLGVDHEPTARERAMFDAILGRHTNRRPFEARSVPEADVERLASCATAEGVWFEGFADDLGKRPLAALVAEANRAQLADDGFREELASWIRDPEAGDGMPSHGVPLSEVGDSLQAFLRSFDAGAQVARDEQTLALGSPLLVMLGTDDDDSRAWLASGQALAAVLLTASAAGLSASFLNQPLQVPSQRPLVGEAIGREGHPQLLLRLGYGPPTEPTPRRRLDAVLLESAARRRAD